MAKWPFTAIILLLVDFDAKCEIGHTSGICCVLVVGLGLREFCGSVVLNFRRED